jgi:hypothetical protein
MNLSSSIARALALLFVFVPAASFMNGCAADMDDDVEEEDVSEVTEAFTGTCNMPPVGLSGQLNPTGHSAGVEFVANTTCKTGWRLMRSHLSGRKVGGVDARKWTCDDDLGIVTCTKGQKLVEYVHGA